MDPDILAKSTIQGMSPEEQRNWWQTYQHFLNGAHSLSPEQALEYTDNFARAGGWGAPPPAPEPQFGPMSDRPVRQLAQMPVSPPIPTPRPPQAPGQPQVDPQQVSSVQPPRPPQMPQALPQRPITPTPPQPQFGPMSDRAVRQIAQMPSAGPTPTQRPDPRMANIPPRTRSDVPVTAPTQRPFTGAAPVPTPSPRPITELAQGPSQASIMNAFGQAPAQTPRPDNRLAALGNVPLPTQRPPDIEPGAMVARQGMPTPRPAPRPDIEPGGMMPTGRTPTPQFAQRPSLPDIEPGAMRVSNGMPTPSAAPARPSSLMNAFGPPGRGGPRINAAAMPTDPRLDMPVGNLAGPRTDPVATASTSSPAPARPQPRPQAPQQPQRPQQPQMSLAQQRREDMRNSQFGNRALAEALMKRMQIGQNR